MFSRIIQLGIRRQLSTQTFRTATKSTRWFHNNTNYNRYKRFNFQFGKRFSSQASPVKKPSGIKALIQEYGYSALGVYLALSCIDLPLCFLLVHSVGVDQVREYQSKLKEKVKGFFGYETKKHQEVMDDLNAKAEEEKEEGGFWNNPLVIEAVLAYAIHKSLVFIRVPITAAVTPSVVKVLRGWGFKLGNQQIKAIAQQAKAKTTQAVANRGKINNKINLGTPPSKRQKWYSWFF